MTSLANVTTLLRKHTHTRTHTQRWQRRQQQTDVTLATVYARRIQRLYVRRTQQQQLHSSSKVVGKGREGRERERGLISPALNRSSSSSLSLTLTHIVPCVRVSLSRTASLSPVGRPWGCQRECCRHLSRLGCCCSWERTPPPHPTSPRPAPPRPSGEKRTRRRSQRGCSACSKGVT